MRNIYYTYHVSRSDNPDVEKSMETIEDVLRYTKLAVLAIYKNMLHEGNVKGWTVSRTPLPKNKKEKSPTRRGVTEGDGEVVPGKPVLREPAVFDAA